MIITKIERQKNNKNRFSVFIDDQFAFGMDGVDVLFYKIEEGMEIDNCQYDYLMENVVLIKAKSQAMRYLGYSLRSQAQVEKKLSLLGYSQEIIDQVLEMLIRYNYINDLDYAKRFISEKTIRGSDGLKKIKFELQRRGVDKEVIEEALEDFDHDPTPAIVKILEKRLRYDDDRDTRRKAFNYLITKGFSVEEIKEGFRQYDEDNEEVDGEEE